ncbi:MAG: CSLREA domain-containing protein [Anaerolineales bacterium]|nr:CSLREA domain-containing protein [Anaerolineales bacterium]
MDRYRLGFAAAIISLLSLILLFNPPMITNAGGGIIPVNTVDDSDDGVCDATHCSLREAINWANTMPGAPTITFDIPGPSPHEIALCHMLPPLTSSGTTIDGSSEPDYTDTPVVVLKPAFVPANPPPLTHVPECIPPSIGLWIDTSDITVRALSIVGFRHTWASIAAGIVVNSGTDNMMLLNYIGIDPSGAPDGNRDGVLLGAAGQEIWTNAISGNENGIHILAGDQAIYDNRIGTNFQGDSSGTGMGNYRGIYVEPGADGNLVGSSDPVKANVVSGNTAIGIEVLSDDNQIRGNRIGTNKDGDAALPNMYGVGLGGQNNELGGSDPNAGNLISGNDLYGVVLGMNSSGNEILGNKIGSDLSGTSPLGNEIGIFTWGGDNNIIGKNPPGFGNLIAFNTLDGIMILGQAKTYFIAGNTITQNGGDGVILGPYSSAPDVPQQITLNRNSIFDNGELGIDLYPDGVTPNDPGDTDTGPNTLLNFPVFSQVTTTSAMGTACTGCRVEAFLADGDPSGHGEGMTFVGEAFTDVSGNFNIPLDVNLVSQCDLITARATDPVGNSSEFSANERAGPCFVMPPQWLFLIPAGFGLLGLLTGVIMGRTGTASGVTSTAVGTAGGAALGIGLSVLAVVLPSVHVESLSDAERPAVRLPICDQFLDPAAFAPGDGAVLAGDDFSFAWDWLVDPPSEEIRWHVELQGPGETAFSQDTEAMSVPFSDFGLSTEPGSRFFWRLSGEVLDEAGSQQVFCRFTPWRAFMIGQPPPVNAPPWTPDTPVVPDTPTPTPTPTMTPSPSPTVCVYTALQNANCRASDYVESAQITVLLQGESADLIALNPPLTHGKFELQNQQQCWIWLGLMDGPPNPYGTCGVPVVGPPPKPTDTPTPPACRPDLDREACELSGGTWNERLTTSSNCVCPQ